MKQKSNIENFISKYQLGDTVYNQYAPYEFDPTFETAMQKQVLKYPNQVNLNNSSNQFAYQSRPQTQSALMKAVPFIGPAINLGIGIKNIVDSFGQRKRQKQYERAYRRDLERRMNEARTNDFYHTPYEYNWSNNAGSFQQGGMIDFYNYYDQKENQNQLMQQQFEDYYIQKNEQLENRWKQNRNAGFNSLFQGVNQFLPMLQEGGKTDTLQTTQPYDSKYNDININKAKALLKLVKGDTSLIKDYYKIVNGGKLENLLTNRKPKFSERFREHQEGGEYNPKTDLYSKEYDPNEFLDIAKNEVDIAVQEDQIDSQLSNWIFEEDDYEDNTINDQYFHNTGNIESTESTNNVMDKIGLQESGGDYNAINPYSKATGKYQFLPSAWAGRIKSFMNLPNYYNREQVMESFRRNPQAQESFMEYVTNTIYKPEIQKLLPLAQRYGLDENKLIRMMHYRGLSDTKQRLQTGDFEVSEEEKQKYKNPDIIEYLNK